MQEIMGDAIEVGFETYLKNNHTEIEAMTLKKKGLQTKVMLSPAIHLQDLYILYKKEGDSEKFHACLVEIKKLYMEQESKGLDFIDRDWDSIKGSICMNLLYEDWNKEWLEEEEVSHCKFLNFVIVLRSIVDISSQGIGSMVVTKELMSYWQITEEELWAAAWNNLYQERFYIQNMNEVIKSEIKEHEMDINYKEMDSILPYFISAILKETMSDNYIKRQENTACAYVRLPKPSGVEGNAYTISQVKTMLERAYQTQNRAMELLVAVCCLAGGLRRSELAGLRWEDIVLNRDEAYIKVQRSIVQVNSQLIEKETKTKSGRRIIPLAVGGTVYQILERERKEHMKFQSEPGFEGGNSVFIMNQEPHASLTPMGLYKSYK